MREFQIITKEQAKKARIKEMQDAVDREIFRFQAQQKAEGRRSQQGGLDGERNAKGRCAGGRGDRDRE